MPDRVGAGVAEMGGGGACAAQVALYPYSHMNLIA